MGEALYRTAISRLHYGIFHSLIALFKVTIPERDKGRCHAFVSDLVENRVDNWDIVQLYKNLGEYRNRADYSLSLVITRQDYERALRVKDELLALIEENPDFLVDFGKDSLNGKKNNRRK